MFSTLTWVSCSFAQSGLDYRKDVQPILEEYCYDCHADGSNKGDLELDQPSDLKHLFQQHDKWLAVWQNLRAQTMPPAKKAQPSTEQREKIMRWIERDIFRVDPDNPDPGRVTIRRLNRQEYSNT
ncbi:MAG: c-type cytochrome domain-containing protein, partial [Verrucomicrobiia bacterium]